MKKLLIIKTGNSETFNETSSSEIVSIGDVFRNFFIYKNFKSQYDVHWLTSPFLKEFTQRHLDQATVYSSLNEVNFNDYTLIINLEKIELPNYLEDKTFGIFNKLSLKIFPSGEIINLNSFLEQYDYANNSYEKLIQKLLNISSSGGRTYIKSTETFKYDVGLNWMCGKKWPDKQLEKSFWDTLYSKLSKNYTVSWQEGFNNLNEYEKWIDSCRTIITSDSLGMHISMALNKPTLALFGPTNSKQIQLNEKSISINYDHNNLNQNALLDKILLNYTNFNVR